MSKCTFHYFIDPFTELDQLFRSFSIRYLSYLKQKSIQPQILEELELGINRILNGSGEDSRQIVLGKLLQLEMKGDYHQVIALTLLQDVAKWSKQYHQILSQQRHLCKSTQLHQALILQSTTLINSQQQFHTIVPKQNDLLKQLLTTPFIITYHSLQPYRTFYRKLKDIKEFYPQTVKEHQKIVFLKTIEESVEVIRKCQQHKLLQWLFANVFAELDILEPGNQFVTGRLKLLKKIVKALWYWTDQILYKAAFIVVKFSNCVLTHPHVFNSVFNLYQDLLPILIQRVSPCPLILYNHLVLNNLKKLLSQHIPQSKPLCHISLQILLNSLTNVFASEHLLQYFMLHYDCNFMEQPICQNSLNLLFEFVQNRANQKKYYYQVFKKYLKKATDGIRLYLNKRQHNTRKPQEKLVKFYEVKKKQYMEIVNDMNEKPKKLFKKLQSISNKEIKEEIMRKYSRIAKRSVHLDMKKMIDLFAANSSTSEELFGEYVHLLFSNLSKDVSLEEFLRFFSSNFFLNGESQQILRVLDKITVLFYNHQPSHNKILRTSDSTYTFANAIILLNCDLHNPQNQTKMQIESFYKICKRINDGHDLSSQLLTQTYTSIKKNKINTFRNKAELINISANNFLLMCQKEDEWQPCFYDMEMKMLTKDNFYTGWLWELLAGIIDERETMKLEQLIQRFVYSDDAYQCEVVELVRKLAVKKQHIPLHAFQKILEHANFKHVKTSQKTISYLWLATTLIQTFPSFLPTNVICQLLILTWRLRCQIRDDMYLREKAQIRRIKKLLREYQKRQTKKSIMDMFSSFLSAKDEEQEPQTIEEFNLLTQTSIRKMNHKILTEKVLDVLLKNTVKVNHRSKAIEFFVGYLRNDEQKLFDEFLSLLYLIFHLLYRYEAKQQSSIKLHQSEKDSDQSPKQNYRQKDQNKRKSSALSLSQQIKPLSAEVEKSQFDSLIQDLFYELLGLKQSSITRRIQSLKKKDLKKYQLLQSYSRFWVLKILLNKIQVGQVDPKQHKQPKEDNLLYLLNKSVEYIERTDRETFIDLVYEFQQKAKQVFERVYRVGQNTRGSENMAEQNDVRAQGQVAGNIEEKQQLRAQINDEPKIERQKKPEGQGQQQNVQERKEINRVAALGEDLQKQGLDDEHLIQRFILNYRRVILEMYVNCERIVGKAEMRKGKEWKWLVHMEKMIKDVMKRNEDVNEANVVVQQMKRSISQQQKGSKDAQSNVSNIAKVHQEQTQKIEEDKTSKVQQAVKDKGETKEQEKGNVNSSENNSNNCPISAQLPQIKAQLQQQMDIECGNQQIIDGKDNDASYKDIQGIPNEAAIEDEELLQKIQKIERDFKQSQVEQKKLQTNGKQHGGQEAEENQSQAIQEKVQIEDQTKPFQQENQKQVIQQGNNKQNLQQRVQHFPQHQPINEPESQTDLQLPTNPQPLQIPHQQNSLTLIQQQQQQIRRLQQLYYSSNGESSDLVGMPVYML